MVMVAETLSREAMGRLRGDHNIFPLSFLQHSCNLFKGFILASNSAFLVPLLTFLHIILVYYYCAGSCEPGSRCRPNECIFGSGKPRGVGILEWGVYEQGEGNGKISLRATRERGGWILSQQGGFQVSKGRRMGSKRE